MVAFYLFLIIRQITLICACRRLVQPTVSVSHRPSINFYLRTATSPFSVKSHFWNRDAYEWKIPLMPLSYSVYYNRYILMVYP